MILLAFSGENPVQRLKHRPSSLRDGLKYAGSVLACASSNSHAVFDEIEGLERWKMT